MTGEGDAPSPRVRVVRDPAELASAALEETVSAIRSTHAERAEARVALAGGTTPLGLYRALGTATGAVDWSRIRLFWSDERCVPPTDPASNYRAVKESLLAALPATPAGVHRMCGEAPRSAAIEEYEGVLARHVAPQGSLFDLAILGVGADGHTASLFPGGAELEAPGLVAASRAPETPHDRITLTLAALARSRVVVFLAAGEAKALAVASALSGKAPRPPAGRVQPRSGEVLWIVDRAAAPAGAADRPRYGAGG